VTWPDNWQLREFNSTRGYADSGANGLFWSTTVGRLRYSRHRKRTLPPAWGYHAGESSRTLAGVEIIQPKLNTPVDDETVFTVAIAIRDEVMAVHKHLTVDMVLQQHCQLPQGIRDGKTDVFYPPSNVFNDRVRAALRSIVR
jgi:hypothetical protein